PGAPHPDPMFVSLEQASSADPALVAAVASARRVMIGVATEPPDARAEPLLAALTCTLVPPGLRRVPPTCVAVADLEGSIERLVAAIGRAPRAALTLVDLLRATDGTAVGAALAAESFAYSMLLASPEFGRWRARRPVRPVPPQTADAVVVERDGGVLRIMLNRPARRNAFDRHLRDGLCEALDLVSLDLSIASVELTGAGPAFCSGGDLDEFGSTKDVAAAHLIRLARSVPRRLAACGDRVRVVVHGACVGAGVELPSFAARVEAHEDTLFQLPEISMGLLPAAGGTVGLPRRIGRWRTAYLALSGERIGVDIALDWGLVDAVA
ncbi:MAG TPA: enoyl-CoA hydratase/isomerase family protein, partial [Polyangia bacterium]|nr:enoyl-CoA hydratase/isomerase family protein [Polyangia bacterium]